MATSNISTQAEKDNLISSPDWGGEARVPNRALWEIAAIAGDVSLSLRKSMKERRLTRSGRLNMKNVLEQ